MAKLKKAVSESKGGMEIAYDKAREACEASGEPFNEQNFEVEETPEEKLSRLIPSYQVNKAELDNFKKKADTENAEIKEIMTSAGLEEFVVGSAKVTCTESSKESFIEEALINKLKELKIKGIIKKKEYVDMDALESALYHGKINPLELAPCQETKKTITLRLSKFRG